MRYEIRWSNGLWKIFDTWKYQAVEAFLTFKEAEERFNAS